MEHHFNVEMACVYGIEEAILFENFYFWIEKNRANHKHFYNGQYWTYNSKQALTELFPYMNDRKIGYALKNLIDNGLIETGNFNEDSRNRTLWYSITKKGYCILQNCQMEQTKLSNGTDKIVKCINTNTNNISSNTDRKQQIENTDIGARARFVPPTVEEVGLYVKEKGYHFDAESFVAYYASKGWVVGKSKMKDWHAACVTWEKKWKERQKPKPTDDGSDADPWAGKCGTYL